MTTFIDRDFPGGGTIKRFEIATGKENGSFPLKEKERFVNISADGKTFLTYSDGIIQIRGMTPFPMRREFRIYPDRVAVWGPGFALSPDSSLLAHEDSQTKTIKIWRIPTGEVMHSLDCPEKKIRGFASSRLAFSRSGKFLACASADKSVRIWNAQSGEMLQKIVTPDRPLRLAFSPNEQWLAIGSVDAKSRLSIRETATWKEIASWEPELYNSRTIAFSPSGNLLASTGGRSYQVWEISKIGRPDPKTPDKTR
ncbi:hypothetical protein HY256_09820 [Candidatus Sumerlaeota bacterium]|nr:hypothetical protein [Candidatus Sumerlaeota bacterium]